LLFGCHRIGIDPAGDKPVICTGEGSTFVCMPLSSHTEPECDTAKINVIASSTQPPVASATSAKKADTVPAVKRRRRTTAKRSPAKPTDKVALLQTAEQIRQDLRNSLIQVNTLIREVKAQRQQDRLLRSTMDSLKKLNLNIV
jgi:hypothetical protein